MFAEPAPSASPAPSEIARWNWGAFLLNWIWGIGNNTFIALLALVPFVNLVMIFVLGAKGSEWAWRNKNWESVEHFKRVQRNWAVAGAAVWLALLGLIAAIFFSVMAAIKGSDVYRLALANLNANFEATQILGAPVEPGFPMGSIRISGPSGEAELSIPVQGSKAKGTLYLQATKKMGQWHFDRIELEVDGHEQRIDLNSKVNL
jgi:Cytochrome oxidase complex assembly protein 1